MLPALIAVALFAAAPASGWEQWEDRGGTRFSPLAQITLANVGNLVRAWEFRTGDLDICATAAMARTKFRQARCSSRTASSSVRPSTRSSRSIPAAARRSGDTIQDQHQSVAGKPLRLPRRGLLGRYDRRQRDGLSPDAAGRSALAVVARHRPAWWAVLEQGDRAGARDYVEGGCGVALAPPRRKRIRVSQVAVSVD